MKSEETYYQTGVKDGSYTKQTVVWSGTSASELLRKAEETYREELQEVELLPLPGKGLHTAYMKGWIESARRTLQALIKEGL